VDSREGFPRVLSESRQRDRGFSSDVTDAVIQKRHELRDGNPRPIP